MPIGVTGLLRLRLGATRNTFRILRRHSKLKIAFVAVCATAIWIGIFLMVSRGLTFMDRNDFTGTVKLVVVDFVLSVFFLALLVLLTFSNGIIAFGSLFRSRETAFLMSSPVEPGPVFAYRLTEGIMFSSWAFLFLGMPIILAHGLNVGAPWGYYPGALVFFGAFALIPAALGGLVALLVARVFAASPRRVLVALLALAVAVTVYWVASTAHDLRFGVTRGTDAWLSDALGKLSFSQNPFLPSYWVASGVGALAAGKHSTSWYYFQLVLSNALLAGMIAYWAAGRIYIAGYHRCQSVGRRPRIYGDMWLDRAIEALMVGVPRPVRLMVVKDVKTFRRDVVQWSQVLIFFGLLAVYLLNIRRFRYDQMTVSWRNMVSFLNLGATALTLSTFTTRFIFPLLSLEGRNFWVLALMPLERRRVLHGKFIFAFAGSLVLSETLIVLSDLMLRMPWRMVALHVYLVFVICAGLSGLSVGLGALFPNLREENPSKIVSGFGGTLNLMLSMLYLVSMVCLFAIPCHIAFMGGGTAAWLSGYLAFATVLAAALGALATCVPLWLGGRAFEELEA